jgi:ABC-type phosphate transport system substrate-binding protein
MNIVSRINVFVASALLSAGAAQAELVVIVNAKNASTAMTAEQVTNVYLGKDAAFVPADLPDASSARSEFYTKVAGKDPAQVKATWARLVFTGKAQPPKEVADSAAAVKYVASNEKAIAYVEKSAVDPSVKAVLTVN